MHCEARYLIGVDVGSASARAGVFNAQGTLLSHAKHNITIFHGTAQVIEQSGNEIWQAVCHAVREAVTLSGIDPAEVASLSFDATCSLVVVGEDGVPLPVSTGGEPERNIIMWMDHRATKEADYINSTGHPLLKYVGNRVSPEMEMPKLLWLKTHNPDTFSRAWQFFDLTDYLTWRATGDLARSLCTLTCKWNYPSHKKKWDKDYLHTIGLSPFVEEDFFRIGQRIIEPGTPCGNGLNAEAAAGLGLPEGTAVAAGLIDAHAGGVGSLGAAPSPDVTLVYVFGTSSCTMTSTRAPAFVPGVWGPYFSAMMSGLWLNEGGQSAAGAAIDRLAEMHPAASEATTRATEAGVPLPVYLANEALKRADTLSATVRLASHLHIVPEFSGNRAPLADPYARAVIAGLGMERDVDSLIALYVAGICSLGYGLRQIIEAQAENGINTARIVICGGAGQHPLVRQLVADTCQLPVLTSQSEEPVLLGSAMLAAVAGGLYASLPEAVQSMTSPGRAYLPDVDAEAIHARRYQAFTLLQQTAKTIRDEML